MLTKKQLIEFIKHSPEDTPIRVYGCGEIVHILQDGDIFLSAVKPSGYCLRCGNYVYPEIDSAIDYPYYCPTCDENMYSFEVKKEKDNE